MPLQCVEEGTYALGFRGQLLWSSTGGNEVPEVTSRPPATEGGSPTSEKSSSRRLNSCEPAGGHFDDVDDLRPCSRSGYPAFSQDDDLDDLEDDDPTSKF